MGQLEEAEENLKSAKSGEERSGEVVKRIRVGIIGQGRSGYNIHAHSIRLLPEKFEIVAVSDPLRSRCEEAQKNLNCAAYEDYRELLAKDDLDLVVNASPSHLHVPITLEAFNAGLDVLCEKPLARFTEEVETVIEAAEERGRFFTVYQQSRFAPYFQTVKDVIGSGVLGRIVMIKIAFNSFVRRWDWQTLRENYGGSLLNTGPHPLDQVLQLFGTDRAPEVFCLMDRANTFGNAEDHVKVILYGDDRPTIDLEISSCCTYPLYTYQLFGTRGGLTGNTKHLEWKYFKEDEAPRQELRREPLDGRRYCREELKWYEESWDLPEEQSDIYDYMALRFYTNLHAALTEGAPLEVKPEHILRQIAVIEECHRQNPFPDLSDPVIPDSAAAGTSFPGASTAKPR